MSTFVAGNMESLTAAPERMPLVRELVWDMAVCGRLTCSSIQSWRRIQLGEVGQWGSGGTPLKTSPGYYGDGIPWLVIGDLNDGLVTGAQQSITLLGLANSSARIVPVGSVLVAMYGSIGKLGITGIECATNQAIAHCRPDTSLVSARYLFILLRSMRGAFVASGQGLAQQNISQKILKAAQVILPPLDEQRRIVAKVDELMALCDRLEARQKDAEAAHARLVQALLHSLTQARDANDFQACWQRVAGQFELLFNTETSVDALKNVVMQAGVEGRLHQGAPRSAWRTAAIETFCTVQGGIQKTPLRAPVRHHYPYLRVANVQRGRVDVAELERYELAPDELVRWRLIAGDLLIVEGNGSANEIGRCAIWRGEVADCVYQNHLMRVRPTAGDSVEYLSLYLNSPVGTAHMRRLAITTSGLFNLSVGKIRSIPIELPPKTDQPRIVTKVSELLALCDQLKARIAAARAKHAQLAQALVEATVD